MFDTNDNEIFDDFVSFVSGGDENNENIFGSIWTEDATIGPEEESGWF